MLKAGGTLSAQLVWLSQPKPSGQSIAEFRDMEVVDIMIFGEKASCTSDVRKVHRLFDVLSNQWWFKVYNARTGAISWKVLSASSYVPTSCCSVAAVPSGSQDAHTCTTAIIFTLMHVSSSSQPMGHAEWMGGGEWLYENQTVARYWSCHSFPATSWRMYSHDGME